MHIHIYIYIYISSYTFDRLPVLTGTTLPLFQASVANSDFCVNNSSFGKILQETFVACSNRATRRRMNVGNIVFVFCLFFEGSAHEDHLDVDVSVRMRLQKKILSACCTNPILTSHNFVTILRYSA